MINISNLTRSVTGDRRTPGSFPRKPYLTARWGALLLFLGIGTIFPRPAATGSVPASRDTLTLRDCIGLATERNPLLLSAEEQYQASLARIRQARALPQPSLDIDSDLQPGIFDFRESEERYVGISQSVPFPGRTWLRGKVAIEESNEVAADRDLLRLDLIFQVTHTFYGVLLAQEQLDYARQNEDLTRDFVQMTEVRFQAGDLAQVELVRARVEAARAASEVRARENDLRLSRARLNFLLARRASAPFQLQGELRIPPLASGLEELTRAALEARPEVARIRASLAKESLRKTQGYFSYFPDFDVGVAQHRQTGEADTWDVTLSLSLPVFFWQPARGEVAEADANRRALQEEASHLANSIALEVEEAYVSLTTAADQIRLFEEGIVNQAEDAYRMYQFSFQQGEIGAIDLIEARRTLNDARTSYADALFTYDVAWAAIERAVGRPVQEQEDVQDPSVLVPFSGALNLPVSDSMRGGLPLSERGGLRNHQRTRDRGGPGGGTLGW